MAPEPEHVDLRLIALPEINQGSKKHAFLPAPLRKAASYRPPAAPNHRSICCTQMMSFGIVVCWALRRE